MELPEPTARNALRLLQYLSERERRREAELPEIPAISEVIGLTLDDTSDLIDILDSEGAIKANRTIDGGKAPMLTGHGKLMLAALSESLGEKDTQPDPQEFQNSPDYATVIWRGREIHLSSMQSHAVRLLHEEFQQGRNDLRDAYVIVTIEANVRTLHDLFKRSCGVWDKLIIKGERQGTHRLNLSRQVPPDSN